MKKEKVNINCVTRKFLEVSLVVMQNNGKEMYKNVCCTCIVVVIVFLVGGGVGGGLVRPNEFFGRFRCRRRLALRDIIFCSSTI